MTSIIPIQCLACTRLRQKSATCTAFPAGIPAGILGGDDHRKPHTGDNGVVFLPRKDAVGLRSFREWQMVFGNG